MTKTTLKRVFFALWPDAAALKALDDLAACCARQCGGRRIARESLHLTLAFIGSVLPDRLEALLVAASNVREPPVEMIMDRIGCWPRNHILWCGCEAAPLLEVRLHRSLSRELANAGFPLDPRPHIPHVTLVREANCERMKKQEIAVPWRSETFSLVESILQAGGSRYEILAQWQLVGNE